MVNPAMPRLFTILPLRRQINRSASSASSRFAFLSSLEEISPSPMGFLRRVAGIFGFSRDDADHHHHHHDGDSAAAAEVPQDKVAAAAAAAAPAGNVQRRGFSVQVPVPVERQGPGPVLVPCPHGDGGVQGLRWYTRKLRIDEDGDVAHEFLDEVVPESSISNDATAAGRFQVKYNTKSAALAMRKQISIVDGDIRHSLEYQGQLRLV